MICSAYGYTRQGYYKHLKQAEAEQAREAVILEFVRLARQQQPRAGVRKLYHMLIKTGDPGLVIGRDKLFELLRAHNLLVNPKRRFIRTTDPDHKLPVFPNLLDGYVTNGANQAWVVDITYLNTCRGFAYLFLVSDLHSRKIISHVVSGSLKAEHACRALEQALLSVRKADHIIHHSDHGSQYCSHIYREILNRNKMRCSMTGPGKCYDNAVAERIIGILKQEFGLKRTFPDLKTAEAAVKDAVYIYNNIRLHAALGYETPQSVYGAAA